MCGIAGVSCFNRVLQEGPDLVKKMTDAMLHRGPDDEGMAVYNNVVLGHRRLSIIDLSGGKQPIYNEDMSIVVVYNGELYNSPELRRELIIKGHTFKTKTDTEILVHLYEEEGIDFLKRLNGMFALALYDTNKHDLILARDRFGVKPLLYSYNEGILSFASELNALKSLPNFKNERDLEALRIFLSLYFIPDPWTGYKSVRKLEAGKYILFNREGMTINSFHDLDFSIKDKLISRQEAEEEIARLFRQSVKRQLLADVPVAVSLSGGLDSRTILSSAIRENKETKSFTITFDERLFNEGGVASYWANLFKSPHYSMLYREEDFCQQLVARQKRIGEPYGFFGDTAMEALAFLFHEHGIKVVLSGTGGDELFTGYPTLHAANIARYYRKIPSIIRRNVIRPGVMSLPAGQSRLPLSFKLKSFVRADHPDPYRNFFQFKEVLRRDDMPAILTNSAWEKLRTFDPFVAFEQHRNKVKGWHLIDALTYFDLKVFMAGNLFYIGDHEFMAASVEQRVPFMDNDLVDFVQKLPVNIRFHPYKPKDILRRSFEKHFQVSGSKRRVRNYKKLGFEIPINRWIKKGCFADLVEDTLSKHKLNQTGFFEPIVIQRMLREQRTGRQNHERGLQNIISAQLFLSDN